MKRKITVELNSANLIKHAFFYDYNLPEALSIINLTQERILMTVKNSTNLSMISISRQIGLEKGPFSQSVDKLVALGLIERVRSSSDKRVVRLYLTEEGELLTNKVEESMENHFLNKFNLLSSNEAKQLFDSLDKLKEIATIIISK